jgi:hypothetical protein
MRRLVWGTVLFLCMTAGDGSRLLACDDRPMSRAQMMRVYESGDNTVMISSDDEFVTVIVYTHADAPTEWM